MKRNKLLAIVLTIAVTITSVFFSFTVFGDDTLWSFDEDSATLRIFGTGDMEDYSNETSSPWHSIILKVKNVVIEDGVSSVGDYAFSGATSLESVVISDTIKSIGAFSFSSCPSLTELSFGSNVTSIRDTSFAFNGITPKSDFTLNVLPGTYSMHYAVNNSLNFNCPSVPCDEYEVNINPAGMRAYFPYTSKVSGTFKFYTTGNHDTLGYLYDSSFKEITRDDDSGSSTNFSITARLESGKTYYICASILNLTLTGNFKLFIEPVTYTVSGTINAMLDQSGTASDIILTSATMNGQATGGKFALTINEPTTAVFACDNAQVTHTFSPDDGDNIKISLMVCDVNNDGWVNAKDYAIMTKTQSPYKKVFKNFTNYKIN